MLRVARLSLQRPRLSLLAWAATALVLALIGLGVNDATSPSKTVIPGTEASRAEHLTNAEFGPGVLVGILLEGPKRELNRQGPAIVRALRARGDTRTISAWDRGSNGARMRPRDGAAMIMASVARSEEYMYRTGQDQIDATVDRITAGPVRAYVNSTTTLDRGMTDAAIDTARTATLVTIPILFVALLVILRAPLAAFTLTAFAGVTALAGFGVIALAAAVVDIAALTIPLGAMAALTFGVGFGLPMHRRWREELVPGGDAGERRTPALAAAAAVATSGRAVLIGGTAMIAAMVVASQVGPSEILISEGIGVVLCAMMAVGGAVVVLPPVLALMGARMEWMSFPAPAPLDRAWKRVSGGGAVVRAALPLGAMATVVLLLIAVPAVNLEAGSLSPQRLPEDNTARIAYEEMQRVMGPAWRRRTTS